MDKSQIKSGVIEGKKDVLQEENSEFNKNQSSMSVENSAKSFLDKLHKSLNGSGKYLNISQKELVNSGMHSDVMKKIFNIFNEEELEQSICTSIAFLPGTKREVYNSLINGVGQNFNIIEGDDRIREALNSISKMDTNPKIKNASYNQHKNRMLVNEWQSNLGGDVTSPAPMVAPKKIMLVYNVTIKDI